MTEEEFAAVAAAYGKKETAQDIATLEKNRRKTNENRH